MTYLLRNAVHPIITTLAAIVFANCNQGCGLWQEAKDVSKAYRDDLVACATEAPSKAAAQQCIYDVNEKYGLCKPSKMPELGLCREDSAWSP